MKNISAKDYFDYIVVDEFHHAVSNNYNKDNGVLYT